ncbi:hypothetical protein AAMO2058_000552700 [Amorphochlora amoebiformis]
MAHVVYTRALSAGRKHTLQVLMMLRGPTCGSPYTWCVPGGGWEPEERKMISSARSKAEEMRVRRSASVREAIEEISAGCGIPSLQIEESLLTFSPSPLPRDIVLPSTTLDMLEPSYPQEASIQAKSPTGNPINSYYFVCPVPPLQAAEWEPRSPLETDALGFQWVDLELLVNAPGTKLALETIDIELREELGVEFPLTPWIRGFFITEGWHLIDTVRTVHDKVLASKDQL